MKSIQPPGDGLAAMDFAIPTELADRRPFGDGLKSMFDSLTRGPMPDRLLQLADALEEAFKRGDLFEPQMKLDS